MTDVARNRALSACSQCADAHRWEVAFAERGAALNLAAAQEAQALLEAAIDLLIEYGLCTDDRMAEDAIVAHRDEMVAMAQAVTS